METVLASECNGVSKNGVGSCDVFSSVQENGFSSVQENKNLAEDLVDDFDSYWEDINERLTISRMVSDSVIKGMVTAVSQEAAEVIASKERELADMKEALCCHCLNRGVFGASVSESELDEEKLQMRGVCSSFANEFVDSDSLRRSLCSLNQVVKEQLQRLGKYIITPEGIDCPKINLSPDIIDAYCSLKATLEGMSQQVHVIASEDWRLDLKIREEVEAMVFHTIFQGIQDDYEKRLWDVKTVLSLVDRFKEISGLRQDLDSVQKCFASPEHGHLGSHWSQEVDVFHRKVLSSHGLPSGSLWDGNGKCEESKVSMPENLETSKLNHMTKQELYSYFKTEITKMKRDHESTVQQMTEEYFTLKREFLKEKELLKERGPFTVFRKDKDFEMFRKKLSESLVKLDDILKGSEKLSRFCDHSREVLDSLLYENDRLKDMLNDKELELCYLSLQASDATKKLSQHILAENNLHKLLEDYKTSLEDGHIDASISQEVYKLALTELAIQNKSHQEDLDVKSAIMQEIIRIIYIEAIHDVGSLVGSDHKEIPDVEFILAQEIRGIVFQEVLRDMSMKFSELNNKYLQKDESVCLLESKASKFEKDLQVEIEQNKKLNNLVALLKNSIEVKDKLSVELTTALEEKKQQFEVADMERMNLRKQCEALISDKNDLASLKDELDLCRKQIDLYEIQVAKLNETLKLSECKVREVDEELQVEKNNLAMLQAKDREHRKQMESFALVIQGLTKSIADFQLRTTENLRWHNVRLENSAFQLHSFTSRVNVVRRTGLLYRERLEMKCSDLQKAEAEVDLLGDEVDALLSLLEKIYVALDHYSPILQHYPGIMETLKLVRRELSGEALKAI